MRYVFVEREVLFPAGRKLVHEVLTRTWEYGEFLSNVKRAVLLRRGESFSEVYLHASIFFVTVDHTMHMRETDDGNLIFRQTGGFFRAVSGGWNYLDGSDAETTRAKYFIEAQLPFPVPGRTMDPVLNLHFPRMLEEFRREVERRASRPAAVPNP